MLNRSSAQRTAGAISLRFALGAFMPLLGTLALLSCRSVDWFLVKRALRNQFDDVRWITTQQLADWLANKNRPWPILLDVRTKAEWNVSHIPQARLVEPQSDPKRALAGWSKDAPVVTYCSVGYRSAKAARRLRAEGFTNVQNLEGSIFQWANENRPLVRDDEIVRQVHPSSALWGRLLAPEGRAPLESPNDGS